MLLSSWPCLGRWWRAFFCHKIMNMLPETFNFNFKREAWGFLQKLSWFSIAFDLKVKKVSMKSFENIVKNLQDFLKKNPSNFHQTVTYWIYIDLGLLIKPFVPVLTSSNCICSQSILFPSHRECKQSKITIIKTKRHTFYEK